MEARAVSLEVVLSERQQWVVPVYQRHYEWETAEDRQLPKLWEDLKDKAIEHLDNLRPYPHYFGAVIFAEPTGQQYGTVRKRYLVDGQQRITTFELVLLTLRELSREAGIAWLEDVIRSYLFNEVSKGMATPEREQYKLWPSSYDRQLYRHLVDNPRGDIRKLEKKYFYKNGNLIKGQAPNLLRAYWFLYEEIGAFIKERGQDGETAERVLDALLAGFLSGFQIVMIHLDDDDDAQEIFASLNGMAKPLSPFDLIRNDVFHRARRTNEDDERLFDERWKYFEQPFWNEPVRQGRFKRARADHLITHTVVAEMAREVNAGKIATEYQHYAREHGFGTVAEELDVLLAHGRTYRGMEELSDPVTERLTRVLRIWDLSTFHPLVLWVNAQDVEDEQKMRLFKNVESYVIRRELCGLTTKNYNKVVITMIRALKEHGADPDAFTQHVSVELTGDASRLPTDSEVLEAISTRSIYRHTAAPRLRYILQQLEYARRTKFDETTLDTGNLTIEHVMPQKWAENWPLPSGETAPSESTFQATVDGHVLTDSMKAKISARQQVVDTLGNLTMVTGALNPSLSNAAWPIKRERLSKSLLALNRDVADKVSWGEENIQERGASLGKAVNSVWSV
jgi:hypothetical protein